METFSEEAGWEGSLHATVAWSNFSSSFSEHTGLNSTFKGGSYFWLVSQNNSINPTQTPGPVRVRDISLAKAEIGILGLVLALTTLGNGFVLWVLLRRRKYNAPMHLFMVNLCVADLVVAFFQVLPQLVWDITERFQGPDVLCRSVKYLQIVGMFASSYMIVAMTVDRHNAICCPLQAYKGGAVSCWNTPIMVAWGLALVLSVPQVFIFSRSEVSPGVFECWGNFAEPWGLKAYVTWMTIAVFLLPTFIITVCQVLLTPTLNSVPHRNSYNTTTEYSNASSNPSFPPYPLHPPLTGVSKAMSKTVRMTLVIVLVYTLCWSPFFIVQLWCKRFSYLAFTILMLLASLNSCTNPWIYTAFSSSVSRELLALQLFHPIYQSFCRKSSSDSELSWQGLRKNMNYVIHAWKIHPVDSSNPCQTEKSRTKSDIHSLLDKYLINAFCTHSVQEVEV
uniref:Vasopressin V2 receptor n=1 Tax=Sinocyclocheilus grahami TaxID=75366 RepID=A0A672S985_SINGR